MRWFWNGAEERVRALPRLGLQALLLAALCAAPTIAVAEGLAALHRAGVWLPGAGPALFDKIMDFIVGPLFSLLLIAAVLLGGRWIDRRDWRDFGLAATRIWVVELAIGLAIGAMLIGLVFGAERALGWVTVERRAAPGVPGVPVALLWGFVLLKAVCVGSYEELLSRGYLLKNCAEGLAGLGGVGPRGAAAASALLVAILFGASHLVTDHFSWAAFAGLTVNGLLLATPMLLTGRLAMSIGLHMAWNLTQGAIFGYPVSGDLENVSLLVARVSGPELWTGGAYGPEAGLVGMAAMVAGAGLIVIVVGLRGGSGIRPEIALYRGPER